MKRTGGTETSQYPEEKKSTEIPWVAASERGAARSHNLWCESVERSGKSGGRGWKPRTRRLTWQRTQRVRRDTRNPVWRRGDPPPRLNTPDWPTVNQYREGKAKRTGVTGVKENLKPCTYKQWEHPFTGVTAYLLYNGSASCILQQG